MKSMLALTLLLMVPWMTGGCSRKAAVHQQRVHEDGIYRGVFIDGDAIQINVEFTLQDGVVQHASFRHLRRDEDYHLHAIEEPYRSVIQQYQEALNHLIGKEIETHLQDLYTPQKIVGTQVDGYTAATLRSNKIISAVRDGLNRGVYSYP